MIFLTKSRWIQSNIITTSSPKLNWNYKTQSKNFENNYCTMRGLSNTAELITPHSFTVPTAHSSSSSSQQQSFSGIKHFTLGVWGGGPSISEPRVRWKKKGLHKESQKTGLCSLLSDLVTSGSHPHVELRYRLHDKGGRTSNSCIQAELCEAIDGLRTAALPQQRHLSSPSNQGW